MKRARPWLGALRPGVPVTVWCRGRFAPGFRRRCGVGGASPRGSGGGVFGGVKPVALCPAASTPGSIPSPPRGSRALVLEPLVGGRNKAPGGVFGTRGGRPRNPGRGGRNPGRGGRNPGRG